MSNPWVNTELSGWMTDRLIGYVRETLDPTIPRSYVMRVIFDQHPGQPARATIPLPQHSSVRVVFTVPHLPMDVSRRELHKIEWLGARPCVTRLEDGKRSVLAEVDTCQRSTIHLPIFRWLWGVSLSELDALQNRPYGLTLHRDDSGDAAYLLAPELRSWIAGLTALRAAIMPGSGT